MQDELVFKVANELERRARLMGKSALYLACQVIILMDRPAMERWAREGFPEDVSENEPEIT